MNNIEDALEFKNKLKSLMTSFYQFLEFASDKKSEDGEIPCFQVMNQYERPSDFLQSLLDIVRVNFEPNILGTLFLNSNLGVMYDDIPNENFSLGYISITSDGYKDFSSFWNNDVLTYVNNCRYNFINVKNVFAVVSTGIGIYGIDFVLDINETIEKYFSKYYDEISDYPIDSNRIGFCLDDALGENVRISLWMFIYKTEDNYKE